MPLILLRLPGFALFAACLALGLGRYSWGRYLPVVAAVAGVALSQAAFNYSCFAGTYSEGNYGPVHCATLGLAALLVGLTAAGQRLRSALSACLLLFLLALPGGTLAAVPLARYRTQLAFCKLMRENSLICIPLTTDFRERFDAPALQAGLLAVAATYPTLRLLTPDPHAEHTFSLSQSIDVKSQVTSDEILARDWLAGNRSMAVFWLLGLVCWGTLALRLLDAQRGLSGRARDNCGWAMRRRRPEPSSPMSYPADSVPV
jgi:hypothetical protein